MLKHHLQQKISQKLSSQQIQLMNLIQLSTEAFEDKVKQEVEENIALENETPTDDEDALLEDLARSEAKMRNHINDEYRYRNINHSERDYHHIPLETTVSLQQHLESQIGDFYLGEEDVAIAMFLIGSINENGYIDFLIEDLIDDMAFKQNITATCQQVEKIIREVIHKMDPPGIGARNLRECLEIQLRHKQKSPAVISALLIIKSSFDLLTKKHYDKILHRHQIEKGALRAAVKEIESLNPKPGSSYSGDEKQREYIISDFLVRIENGIPIAELSYGNTPNLRISKSYRDAVEKQVVSQKSKTEAVQFVKRKLESAKWFIEAINQRRNTLMLTINAIINIQKKFFLSGDISDIKPMVLKDVAQAIDMDVSTISRVVSDKYADTPHGVYKLKKFFSEGLPTYGSDDVSNIKVKDMLCGIIEGEDKNNPLSDDKLVKLLSDRGISIARRTVAKYRRNLNIPVARLRRSL